MKRISIVALLCVVLGISKAQNIFPSSGNVGIGTTTADTRLHIIGPGNGLASLIITDSNNPAIELRSTGANFPYIDFAINSTSNTNGGWPDYNGRILFNAIPNGFTFYANGYNNLSLAGTGNVGIGTSDPQSSLQVDDGCTKANIGDASGLGLNYGTSYLGFNASRSGTNWLTNNDGNNHNGGGVMYSTIFGDLYFANVPSTGGPSGQTLSDATVKSNINFRIDHDGTTYAKKMIIELTGWPDYVFKPTYHLMPLSEVKRYIDLYHHLPEMPSDKEVEAKGLDVSEMNKLLTKKVEELTLYLIEKDKQQQKQENQVKELQYQVKALMVPNKK